MIFYHGTSQENWDKIQKEGVLWGDRMVLASDGSPSKQNKPCRCTYLAVEKKHAYPYKKPRDVVLKIEYDPADEKWCNNYIDEEWQHREYEPIPLEFITVCGVE